ncbi:MAG: histidine phosphatase family protein [Candidatus Saccharimonadales bacterium]
MQHLYFIRHGLSEMNTQGAWSGHSDTPLTDEGHEQAKLAGKLAKKEGLAFDIIISSPLQRAHHTAKHVAAHVDYPHEKIVLSELFKERNYGVLEGQSAKTEIGQKHVIDESYIDVHPNVESLQQMQDRAYRALEHLRSLDHETILVVSHGSFGRALYRAVNDLPITERNIRYANARLVKFI